LITGQHPRPVRLYLEPVMLKQASLPGPVSGCPGRGE